MKNSETRHPEALAAQLFAMTANDGQVKRLEGAVNRLEAAYKTEGVESIAIAKGIFYDVLLEGGGKSILPTLLRTMNARVTQLRRVSLSSPKRATFSLPEIRAVLRAIKQRDRRPLSRPRCVMCSKHPELLSHR